MTNFVKENFQFFGGYLTYPVDGKQKFVARFKYNSGGKGSWITCLVKNFTVEEYFGRLDAGESPLRVVESKGYILPHIKKWLKRDGYPVTPAGYKDWTKAQNEKYRAHYAGVATK